MDVYWSSPLVAQAVMLGLVDPNRMGRISRSVCRRAGDLASCDLVWAEELVAQGLLTRYQARTLLQSVAAVDETRAAGEGGSASPLKIGPYLIHDRIGSSDLGTTFRCRRPDHPEEYVAKLIEPRWTSDPAVRASIESEVAAWAKLNRDDVVPVELHSHEQQLALVAHWLPATPLGQWFRTGRQLSPHAALELVCQVVSTLAAADSRGLVHGDIKASNLLVTKRGQVVLTDCGIRRCVAGAQLAATRNLPPDRYDHTAPEIAGGEGVPDLTSDIYALGCLLYQLICGRAPYSAGTAERKLLAHRSGRWLDPCRLGIELSPEIRAVLAATLEPDRTRRLSSYSELLSRVPPSTRDRSHRARSEIRRIGSQVRVPVPLATSGSGEQPMARWGTWLAGSVAVALIIAASIVFSSRILPVLHIRTAGKSQPIISSGSMGGPAQSPVTEPSAVTALWNASEDLRRAYDQAAPHNTITLKSPGPFLLDAIEITKPITLRGAPEVRPLFIGGPGVSLRVRAAGVRLENMHFLRLADQETQAAAAQPPPLIEVSSPEMTVTHCSFQDLSPARASAVLWHPGTDSLPDTRNLRFDCVLFRDVGSAVSIRPGAGSELTVENCLHLGPGPLVRCESGTGKAFEAVDLVLTRVTVYGATVVEHGFPHPLDDAVPLRIVARESWLLPSRREQPLLAVHYAAQPTMLMPKVMWSGSGSICPADSTMLEVVRGQGAAPWRAADFAAWKKYWGSHSTGLVGARIPFADTPPNSPLELLSLPATDGANPGADLSQLLLPPTLTTEQITLLVERLKRE